MVAERTKPQKSEAPPRTLNVQKFAESRASELAALHSIVKSRLDNDFRYQRNKRRRTTGHDNRLSRKRLRKKQKVGEANDSKDGFLVKDEKKVPRRVRRRIELKKNPQHGFSATRDGTKRLRTHLWHAKRFTITKIWGFCLPLGLHGRGKGSRAILKKLKEGVLVHDASYYGVVQLDGPEDLLLSILSSVLVPFPSGTCDERSRNILSGVTHGSAMLHHVGSNYRSIAPVTYMWRSQQSNFVSKESKTATCDEWQKDDGCTSPRQLWLWIHPAAFQEGYGVLESICGKLKVDGHSINCISLEGELAKLELIGGSRAFQLIQKILHPVMSQSVNPFELQCSVFGTDGKTRIKDTSSLPNEDEISTSAIISLIVNDPRVFVGKAIVSEPPSSKDLGTKESETEGNTSLDGIKVQKMDPLSPLFSMPDGSCKSTEFVNLWDACNGILPPLEENFLCKEKYRQSLKFFGIAHQNLGIVDTSGERPPSKFSHICPLMLLKDKFCDSFTRWSIILPLSWVKAFWISIISNGAQAIGLRERHWIACEAGLSYFPSDFPDTKAHSCYMEMEEAHDDKKTKLKPLTLRHLRVPTWPCWEKVQSAPQIKSAIGHAKVPFTDHSMKNVYFDAALDGHGADLNGCIARTSYMLTHSLAHFNGDNLLLFPKLANVEKSVPVVIKDEEMVKQSKENGICSELECCQKLYFVRACLRAYKEGVFEEGAVVCAPHSTDIPLLTTRTDNSGGKCQIPQSLLGASFDQAATEILELQLPDDPLVRESIRAPIGFVTTGFVQGSKKPTAMAICAASWLAYLRDDQSKTASKRRRRKEIYVLVRNLRSTAYRLALATIVLEGQEDDLEYM